MPIDRKTQTGVARHPSPGTGCISLRNGRMICGLLSFCWSHFAESAPGVVFAPEPRTWTTWSRIKATGRSSRIGIICRASAIPVTAAKHCWKTPRKQMHCEPATGPNSQQLWAHAHTAAPARMRGWGSLQTHPGVKNVFSVTRIDRGPPFTQEIFPTAGYGEWPGHRASEYCGDAADMNQALRGRSESQSCAVEVQRVGI